MSCSETQLVHTLVVEVCNGESAKISVIICRCWSVDDNSSDDTITVLVRVVRMIPRSSMLSGTESIHLSSVWFDWAFCYTVYTMCFVNISVIYHLMGFLPIHDITVLLHKTMPVNARPEILLGAAISNPDHYFTYPLSAMLFMTVISNSSPQSFWN